IHRLADAAAFLDAQDQRLLARAVELNQSLIFDEMNGLPRFAAESDENVGGHVGMPGETGQGTIQLIVVGSAILHGAAVLVSDGDDAIDFGVPAQEVGGLNAFGNVLAGAGRAVDRADDGNVVARAVAAVAAVVTEEGTRLGYRRR